MQLKQGLAAVGAEVIVFCPLWKCSILLLKANLSSPATFCNQEEEFGKEGSVILLTVETEHC